MSELPTYKLERVLDAPRQLVWRAWTDPGLLPRWYGPNVTTLIHRFELRPGGLWLTEMRMDKGSRFERSEFTEVTAPERLVCLMSTTDADWNVVDNPMMPDWPRVLKTSVTLAEQGERTALTLTWEPHEASAAEIACFAGALEQMGSGWEAGMDLLATVLAEVQAETSRA